MSGVVKPLKFVLGSIALVMALLVGLVVFSVVYCEWWIARHRAEVVASPEASASPAVPDTTSVSIEGPWSVVERLSPADDSPEVLISNRSQERAQLGYLTETVRLVLQCSENTTAAYLGIDYLILADALTARFRIDGQAAFSKRLGVSAASKAAGLWRGSAAIPLIKRLYGGEKLFVRIEVPGANDADMTFGVSGLEGEIGPLRAACNWRRSA